MAANDENAPPTDLEEQQRLAQDYQPDVQGPFVSQPHPLQDILEEFEPADPRYGKIQNLAKEFPYLRRMKGDGSCGYRALLFGFLLNLCEHSIDGGSDPQDFLKVIDRHVQAMKDRGFEEMIFEDWVITTRETITSLSDTLQHYGRDDPKLKGLIAINLTSAFNDDEKNSELIQYVRMATSSWLIQVNSKSVEPFIETGQPIDKWCNTYVDPPASELEDLSMKGVFDAFMQQVGMNLTIHDLEQGEGESVAVYVHEATASGQSSRPMPSLHVLYRPGHYDLLLKEAWV